MKKRKILILSNINSLSAAYRYRILYPLKMLESEFEYKELNFYSKRTYNELGRNTSIKFFFLLFDMFKMILNFLFVRFHEVDFVVVKNYVWPVCGKTLEKIVYWKIKDKRILYDIDDAIYLNTRTKRNQYFRWLRNPEAKVRFWLEKADHVITSNEIILEDLFHIYPPKAKENFSCVLSLINKNEYFDNENELLSFKRNRKKIFVWLGSPHTQANIYLWNDLIYFISKDCNNEIHFIGVDNSFILPFNGRNIFYHSWSKEIENKVLKIAHFGLNPLLDNEFEKRKSAFKVIQYYRSGVIPIVSDVGINKNLIEKYGGYIYSNPYETLQFIAQINSCDLNQTIFNLTSELSIESVLSNYKAILNEQ